MAAREGLATGAVAVRAHSASIQAVHRIGEDAGGAGRSRLALVAVVARVGARANTGAIRLHRALAIAVRQIAVNALGTGSAGEAL